MKIDSKIIVTFTPDEVDRALIDKVPERYKGWWFSCIINPDGSATLDGAKGRDV